MVEAAVAGVLEREMKRECRLDAYQLNLDAYQLNLYAY